MNEMANIAECVGADIEQVRRVSVPIHASATRLFIRAAATAVLFPKDVRAVDQTARAHGYEPRILPPLMRSTG